MWPLVIYHKVDELSPLYSLDPEHLEKESFETNVANILADRIKVPTNFVTQLEIKDGKVFYCNGLDSAAVMPNG